MQSTGRAAADALVVTVVVVLAFFSPQVATVLMLGLIYVRLDALARR